MLFTDLKKDIEQGARSIYLLQGDDAYFRSKAEEQIKSAFLTMPELNYTSVDGKNIKGNALVEFCTLLESFPFMAEKRIVKVFEFYPTEDEYEKRLKPLFENFPQTTILIIVNTQGKKGVDLKRKKSVTFIDCNHADRDTVARWAYFTMKKSGVISNVEACESIADYCLCDMSRVSVEVEKLIEFKKDVGSVSKKDVDELVYKDADYRIYEMTGAVARKNYSAFTAIAYDLIEKGMDHTAVLSSLLSYFKNLHTIACSSKSDAALGEILKMKEYGVKKSREQAYSVGKDNLESYIAYIYDCVASVKSGRLVGATAFNMTLSRLFFE